MASIVTKSARKATRWVSANVKSLARDAHRSHRRSVNVELATLVDEINSGAIDLDEVDVNNNPDRGQMVTGWEIA